MTQPRQRQLRYATLHEYYSLFVIYNTLAGTRPTPPGDDPSQRELPVSVAALLERGAPKTILDYLFYLAQVEHLRPVIANPSRREDFEVVESVRLGPDSFFSLTDLGACASGALHEGIFLSDTDAVVDPVSDAMIIETVLLPCYRERQFRWGNHVLKFFKQPAEDQETILLTGEELGWPEWFDDPLPRHPAKNPKTHLHDTIQNLNRNQRYPLVRFKGDGSGSRIGWDYR